MTAADFGSDPGLQPERTAMSWTRTSVALAANGLLVGSRDLISGADHWSLPLAVVTAITLGAAAAVFLIGRARSRRLTRHRVAGRLTEPTVIVVAGLGVTVLGVSLLLTSIGLSVWSH